MREHVDERQHLRAALVQAGHLAVEHRLGTLAADAGRPTCFLVRVDPLRRASTEQRLTRVNELSA